MIALVKVSFICQFIGTFFAVLFNILLVVIMVTTPKNDIGFYRTVMITYALFELVYALIVCLGMPIHYITHQSWIGFTYTGPLADTRFAVLGPTVYCFFYQLWLGFVVFNFIYRYIAICMMDLSMRIKASRSLKALATFAVFLYILLCFFCSHWLCTQNVMTEEIRQEIQDFFDLENKTQYGYYIHRFYKVDGSLSFYSMEAMVVHYFDAYGSLIIIAFCSWNIYKMFQDTLNLSSHTPRGSFNISLERQLFCTLLIQASIPIFLCIIPSFFVDLFPFLPDIFIWKLTPTFSAVTTIPKALDPIITLCCVTQYRRKIKSKLGCTPEVVADISITTSQQPPTVYLARKTSNET